MTQGILPSTPRPPWQPRFAICNEIFQDLEHSRVCDRVAALGYTGLEIAPFTLAERIGDVSGPRRAEVRRQAESAGLRVIGLHWLLARTTGLHLTSPDPNQRRATAEYLIELTRACRDLGGELLVLGSPQQRQRRDDVSPPQAFDYAAEVLDAVVPALDECGVTLCIEPLGPAETNFINTCAEALALRDRLGHPRVAVHLDVKAMATETVPIPDLIRRYAPAAGHFHANDPNRRGPGFGAVDFVPIFAALRDAGYSSWVSVEVFDFTPDPDTIARESLRYMRECAR